MFAMRTCGVVRFGAGWIAMAVKSSFGATYAGDDSVAVARGDEVLDLRGRGL